MENGRLLDGCGLPRQGVSIDISWDKPKFVDNRQDLMDCLHDLLAFICGSPGGRNDNISQKRPDHLHRRALVILLRNVVDKLKGSAGRPSAHIESGFELN